MIHTQAETAMLDKPRMSVLNNMSLEETSNLASLSTNSGPVVEE